MSDNTENSEEKVYIVKTEPHVHDGDINIPSFDVYENHDDAKAHNSEGHWSDHALYPSKLHESTSDGE